MSNKNQDLKDIIWTLWNWIVGLDPGVVWNELGTQLVYEGTDDPVTIGDYIGDDELAALANKVVSKYDSSIMDDRV